MKRKKLRGPEKIELLKRHLVNGVAISKVCEESGVTPSLFYRWQQELFEKGGELLDGQRRGQKIAEVKHDEMKLTNLEAKLRAKDEVIGELMGEYVALKKKSGLS